MNRFKMIITGLEVLAASFAPALHADEWNRETRLTISQPLQIEDTLLAKGEYLLKLLESNADRHVLQIYNANGMRLKATIMGIPAYRLEPTGSTQISLSNPQRDEPVTLKSWFYPGDNVGLEFSASKRAIADRRTSTP